MERIILITFMFVIIMILIYYLQISINKHCTKCRKMADILVKEHEILIKLSKLEYDVLKRLNTQGYKYIARDQDGTLFIYFDAPHKDKNVWKCDNKCFRPFDIYNDVFKFVKWRDEEPVNIQDVLNNYEIEEDEQC